MAKDKKPKPEDYKKLKTVWYKKLARSGFHDIEREGPKYTIEVCGGIWDKEYAARTWEAKTEYYSMARRFLHDYKFKSNLQKVIWEYHTEGISARNIVKLLNKVKVIKPNKDNISIIIRRLVIEMKKMYIPGYK